MIQHVRAVIEHAKLAYLVHIVKICIDFTADLLTVQFVILNKGDFHGHTSLSPARGHGN